MSAALILVIAEGLVAAGAILVAWHFAAELDRLTGEHAARSRLRAAEARVSALLRTAPPLQRHGGRHVPAREIVGAYAGSRPRRVENGAASGGTPEDAPARPGQGTSGVITAPLTPEAAASVLLANRNAEALGFPMRIGLTPQEYASAMHQAAEPYLPPRGENPYPPYVRADRPVTRVRAEGDPFTGSQPVLTDELISQMRGEYLASCLREQDGMTDEQVRSAMRDAMASLRQPSVNESVTAWRPEDVAAYGEAGRLLT
jgi:hypothetical protein